MIGNPFVGTLEERITLARKNLIDAESKIKKSRSSILETLDMVDTFDVVTGKDTYELYYHLWSIVEACDKALEIVFDKEYDMDSYKKKDNDRKPFTNYVPIHDEFFHLD